MGECNRRSRETTEREKRAIVRSAVIVPDLSLLTIQHAAGTPLIARVINTRLKVGNLSSRRLFRRPFTH